MKGGCNKGIFYGLMEFNVICDNTYAYALPVHSVQCSGHLVKFSLSADEPRPRKIFSKRIDKSLCFLLLHKCLLVATLYENGLLIWQL